MNSNTMMREAFIKKHKERAVECAQNGHVIVVAGVKAGNLPPQLAEHPSIVMWDGDQAARRTLPANCGLLLGTKFMGHETWHALVDQARRMKGQALVFPQPLTTGELRALLTPITDIAVEQPSKKAQHVDVQTAVSPEAVDRVLAEAEESSSRVLRQVAKKGETRDFIRVYANLDAPILVEEAKRPTADRARPRHHDHNTRVALHGIRQERSWRAANRTDIPFSPPPPPRFFFAFA